MQPIRSLVLPLGLALAAPGVVHAQQRGAGFTASERVPAGTWVRIRNVNGEVQVHPSTTGRVEVTATVRRRGDPPEVRFTTTRGRDGSLLVCALFTPRATCTEDGYDSHDEGERHSGNDESAVAFDVRVPAGVKVGAYTVNGAVRVDGMAAEVRAATVNGGVTATSVGGPVEASTVNGSIHASMGRWEGGRELKFSTVNGSVVADFAEVPNAEVELSTVNGRAESDWTATSRTDPRHLSATLGSGGSRIRLSTVNGSVAVRKR